MTGEVGPDNPLRRLFGGLVDEVFSVELGICEPAVTDYLGGLLADFIHIDRIYALRTIDNEVIRDLARMQTDARMGPDLDETRRRRMINKYIGDFTLFWTGVYPEQLRPRRQSGVDLLDVYLQQGKQSYAIAGDLTRQPENPPAAVLRQLSEGFEYCVHGLHLVRASWERQARDGGRN